MPSPHHTDGPKIAKKQAYTTSPECVPYVHTATHRQQSHWSYQQRHLGEYQRSYRMVRNEGTRGIGHGRCPKPQVSVDLLLRMYLA